MKLFDVYPLLNLEPVKGKGNYIFTSNGQKYLDFYGGHAVISIGHSHPHYVNSISRQLNRLGFYSNSVPNERQQELADKLGRLSGYEDYQLFLCNSGAEAIENALKMASFQNGKSKVVAFKKAFHGRTSAAVSITDNNKYAAPINKTGEVKFLELDDEESLEKELANGDICAVVIEGIQGIGGIHIPDDDFLQTARQLCDTHNALLICDEIQSGYGRTGRFFAHQHANIQPDIITAAKGMGNGFPIAGTILSPKFEATYGRLGSTFGGNHLACAAGIAVLDVMENEQLVDHAASLGTYLIDQLKKLSGITAVRGRGLMVGLKLNHPVKELRRRLIHREQVITGVSSDPHVLRLLPPLTITRDEINRFIEALKNQLNS